MIKAYLNKMKDILSCRFLLKYSLIFEIYLNKKDSKRGVVVYIQKTAGLLISRPVRK